MLSQPSARRIAVLYVAFAAAWFLLFSASLRLTGLPWERQLLRSIEGAGFVLLSAAVIYYLVRREVQKRGQLIAILNQIAELMPGIMVFRRLSDDVILEASRSFADLVGLPLDEIRGKPLDSLGIEWEEGARNRYEALLREEGEVSGMSLALRRPDGERRFALLSSRIIERKGEKHNLTVAKDITDLEEARRKAEERVRLLRALRSIDRAITGSVDLGVTLHVILDQALENLSADAATILITNSHDGRLAFGASRGMRTESLEYTMLEVGEGYAGRCAATRQTVRVSDLRAEPHEFVRSRSFAEEGFRSYVAAPLVAKGKVVGVLEIFHRSKFDPEPEWMDFLESLAAQAAVAIENATLFSKLDRANLDLRRAYDKTIEGWSRALEHRDRITEGHTRRVTEITTRLAHELGLPSGDLIHIRRGALLHDIGKMAIPDAILHKPGPLDEEEWEVMREHPTIAYRLLAPIEFLRPALDIPYCHHEKWDGTGYPRRLKGEEIPIAARIFAVVDVWDALCSDRPYREAWPENKALGYLEEQAGAHFDPVVVRAFLELAAELDLESFFRGRDAPE